MSKNLSHYYQAWELRQRGKTFQEIGKIMNIGKSRANQLFHYINFIIKERPYRLSRDLRRLISR